MALAPVILYAEDNDDDFVILRCALESAALPHRLLGVENGVEALNYLYADAPYNNRSKFPFPDLVVLDLHMPIMGGLDVLAGVRERIEFQTVPMVILSSDEDPKMSEAALKLGAKEFLIKPGSVAELVEMVRGLNTRWLEGRKRTIWPGKAWNPWGEHLPEP